MRDCHIDCARETAHRSETGGVGSHLNQVGRPAGISVRCFADPKRTLADLRVRVSSRSECRERNNKLLSISMLTDRSAQTERVRPSGVSVLSPCGPDDGRRRGQSGAYFGERGEETTTNRSSWELGGRTCPCRSAAGSTVGL